MSRDHKGTPQPLLVTIAQAGKMLGLSRSMVYLMIQRGELRCIHIGRAARIRIAELYRWVQEREQAEHERKD